MYLIGYDIGSSSVKACLIDAVTGQGSRYAGYLVLLRSVAL